MLVTELPDIYRLENDTFSLSLSVPTLGQIGVFDYDNAEAATQPLDMALQMVFSACLVTLKDSTCAVIRDGSWFAVFDPYSCNKRGLLDEDGKAVIVYHKDIAHVLRHFEELAASLGLTFGESFEITGVNVEMLTHTEESTAEPSISSQATCPKTELWNADLRPDDDNKDSTAKEMTAEGTGNEAETLKNIR